MLGLGSPTHPLSANGYRAWTSTYRWRTLYGYEFLYGASLFMHQLSHLWIDFRGIQDAFMRHFDVAHPSTASEYGLVCSFNPTFPSRRPGASGWISKNHFALDQGPVILMIENHRSDLIWRIMRTCPYIVTGLRRAGFSGGWLRKRRVT